MSAPPTQANPFFVYGVYIWRRAIRESMRVELSDRDRDQLELFRETVRRTFGRKSVSRGGLGWSIDTSPGKPTQMWAGFNEDEFEAFSTQFRKLYMEGERVNFNKVRSCLGRYITTRGGRRLLKDLGKRWNEVLDGPSGVREIRSGEELHLSGRVVLDTYFYGDHIHVTDPDKVALFRRLSQWKDQAMPPQITVRAHNGHGWRDVPGDVVECTSRGGPRLPVNEEGKPQANCHPDWILRLVLFQVFNSMQVIVRGLDQLVECVLEEGRQPRSVIETDLKGQHWKHNLITGKIVRLRLRPTDPNENPAVRLGSLRLRIPRGQRLVLR